MKHYRITKKFVCVLVAIALVLTLAPAAVLAQDGGNKTTPTVTWPAATLTYGQKLSEAKLEGGKAQGVDGNPVNGSFVWADPDIKPSVSDSGKAAYTIRFEPEDTDNYETVKKDDMTVTVNRAVPTINTLPTASALTYGQKLSASKLKWGSAEGVDGKDLPGTFAWTDPEIVPSVRDSGKTHYKVIFTPKDINYGIVEKADMTVTVSKANPTVIWPTASPLTYGQKLSDSVLTGGSAKGVDGKDLPGRFVWAAPDTVPTVGDSGKTAYAVRFEPEDSANYEAAEFAGVSLTVKSVSHGLIDPADPNKPIDLTKDAVFAFNGNYANLAAVRLDGHTLTQTATRETQADLSGYPGYDGVLGDVKSGSVIVTLYKDFLKTLPNGKHTLTVEFADGSTTNVGDAQFTIEKPEPTPSGQPTTQPTAAPTATATPTSPKTGDGQDMALWILLAMIAGAAIAGLMVYRKRKCGKHS